MAFGTFESKQCSVELSIVKHDFLTYKCVDAANEQATVINAKRIIIAPPKTFWQKYGMQIMMAVFMIIQVCFCSWLIRFLDGYEKLYYAWYGQGEDWLKTVDEHFVFWIPLVVIEQFLLIELCFVLFLFLILFLSYKMHYQWFEHSLFELILYKQHQISFFEFEIVKTQLYICITFF